MAEDEVVSGETPDSGTPTTKNRSRRTDAPSTSDELPLYLTADKVAALLRTTRAAIYTMSERGLLPGATRVGRRLLVCRDELIGWLKQNRVPSPGRNRR